jgi:Na+-transporting methylmalonyl-CoA/oxaloacetate decarboxylase gamma subunit
MAKKLKEWIEKIALGVIPAVILLIVTALVKGDELKGLSKAKAFVRVLTVGVPLWLFLILLIVVMFAIARWVRSRQKQLIHVEWKNEISLWCVAKAGEESWMQAALHGFFTNSDPQVALIITSIYLEKTKPAMSLYEPLTLPAHNVRSQDVSIMVKPLLLEEGKTFRGNVILVDQFQRKHKVPIELRGHIAIQQGQTKTQNTS